MSDGFDLNVNKMAQDVQVRSEPIRVDIDQDIYDMRRQIEARQNVRDFIRTEIERLKTLDQQLVMEITQIDLRLGNRKPQGEPKNKRFLYAPGSTYQLGAGEGGAIDGEIVS